MLLNGHTQMYILYILFIFIMYIYTLYINNTHTSLITRKEKWTVGHDAKRQEPKGNSYTPLHQRLTHFQEA